MRYLLLTISIFICSTIFGQNLIARVEPGKMDITTMKLSHSVNEDLEFPSSDIYDDWTTTGSIFHNLIGHVSKNYVIDLREFSMPTLNRKITSPYGQRWGRLHAGIDIKAYIGDTIKAAFSGKVRMVKYHPKGYGYFVVIRHTNGLETLYGHLSKQLVKENQIVSSGEAIGLAGNSGRSTGSHLHFETRILGTPINPALLFDFPNQDVTADYFYTVQSIQKGRS